MDLATSVILGVRNCPFPFAVGPVLDPSLRRYNTRNKYYGGILSGMLRYIRGFEVTHNHQKAY